MTAGQLAACWTLRDPPRVEEYLAGHGRSLSSGAGALLHLLEEQPAFFTAFGVEKVLGDDLFEIRDYSSGKSRLLCSSWRLHRRRPGDGGSDQEAGAVDGNRRSWGPCRSTGTSPLRQDVHERGLAILQALPSQHRG